MVAISNTALTAAQLRSLLDYEESSGVFRWRARAGAASSPKIRRWNTHYVGTIAGTILSTGRRIIRIQPRGYLAHRLAWLYVHGVWPEVEIDHIDGCPLNNAIRNLRLATDSQQQMNRLRQSNNTSGYKGVCPSSKKPGRWQAQIHPGGKNIYLGTFDTPEEAHAAYVEAARKYFGEFARY